jgi:chromosome segregation ATPase
MSKALTVATAIQARNAADETLDGLQKKAADIKQRVDAIREERDEKSFDAHTKGGSAQERVSHLNRELTTLQAQTESISAAVQRAQRDLQSAETELARAEQRAKAEKILSLSDEYELAGAEAHKALQVAFSQLQRSQEIGTQIKALGGHVPEWFTFAGNLDRALAAEKLKIMPAQLIRDLPPPQHRHSLGETFAGIASSIRTKARAIIAAKEAA